MTTIDEDGVYNGSVTVGDDLTPVNSLTVTATSNSEWLVPNANITVGSTGGVRAIADHAGGGHVRHRDHYRARRRCELLCRSARSSLTVDSVNDAPTMTAIGPQTTAEDATTATDRRSTSTTSTDASST